MRFHVFCIGMGALLVAACTTPAVNSRLATAVPSCTTAANCPVGYYSLPHTYLTVSIKPESAGNSQAGAAFATPSDATASPACTALQTAQDNELTTWAGALSRRQTMVAAAHALATAPATTKEVLTQSISDIVAENTAIDAILELSNLRARNYNAFCLPQVELTLAQSVVFDGTRYALFGSNDALSSDTITLTMGAGGLATANIGADDKSEAAVTGVAQLVSIPSRLRATSALDRNVGPTGFLPMDVGAFTDENPEQLRRRLDGLAAELQRRLSYPPARLAPLPRLTNGRQMAVENGAVFDIWPGLWARTRCTLPTDPKHPPQSPAVAAGIVVGVPLACQLDVLDRPEGTPLWSHAFLAFDGTTAAPLGVMRTRFANRTSVYSFADGHLTGSTITAPSPLASIFGLPFKIIENITGGVKKGLTDEKDLVEARENLATAEAERLTAEATLREREAEARAAEEDAGTEEADPPT